MTDNEVIKKYGFIPKVIAAQLLPKGNVERCVEIGDLEQEGMIILLERHKEYKPCGISFRRWAFWIVRNGVISYLRKEMRHYRYEVFDCDLDSFPDEETINHDDFEGLIDRWKELSEVQREIVFMHDFQGLELKEIAELIDSSPAAVCRRRRKAINILKNT